MDDRRDREQHYHRIFEAASVSLWEEDISELRAALDDLRQRGVTDLCAYLDQNPEFVRQAVHMIKVLDVNDVTLRMQGAESKDELLGSLDRTLAPEALPTFRDEIIAIAENKTYFEKESKAQTMQGDKFDILVSMSIPPAGESDTMLVSYMDITRRKRAEEALRRERDLVVRITETSPAGIVVTDDSGQITFANTMAEQVLGLTRDEITQRIYNTLDWHITDYQGQSFPNAQLPFWRVMDTGQPVYDVCHAIEWPDGRRVLLSISAAPLVDPAGRIDGVVATVEDVTEQVRAREALRESEARFRSIVESSPLGMHTYRLAPDGRLVFTGANPAADEILGIDNAQFVGKTIPEAFPALADSEIPERYRLTALTGEPWHADQVLYQENQVSGAFEVHAFRTSPGEMVAAFQDITERKHAEAVLRESEQRLQIVAQISVDVSFELDVQGVITYCSPSMERAFGFPPAHFVGTHFAQHVASEILPRIEAGFRRVVAGELVQDLELEVFDARGAPILVQVNMAPLYEGDSVTGVLGTIRDMTGRRRMENALWQREIMIRALVNASTEAMMLIDLDGTLLELNEATARALGKPVKELIGKCVYGLLPPAVAMSRKAEAAEVVRLREPRRFEDEREGRILDNHVYPVLDAQGDVVQVAIFARDITEQKMVAEARRESMVRRNQELAMLHRVATEMSRPYTAANALDSTLCCVLDAVGYDDGLIHLTQESKSLPRYVTHGALALFSQEEQILDLAERVQAEGADTGRHIWIGDGSELPYLDGVHTVVAIQIEAHEKQQGVMILFSPVPHPLSEAEARLLIAVAHQIGIAVEDVRLLDSVAQIELANELDRLRSKLIANVSHELRTPLGLIEIGCSSLLAEDVTYDRETQLKFLKLIERETEKLSGIVDNLLGLSRVERGEMRLHKGPVELDKLVRDTVSRIKLLSSMHQFTCEVPPGPLWATVDAYACEQVLYNLLNNAIKYSPQGGDIAVRVGAEGQEFVVQVRDQGIGIPPNELAHVFERFYRGQHEQVQRAGGTGLGLVVCRELVRAHGGRIWLESTPGAGTSAFFTLPRKVAQT
jgi:PAS domain S-box-containing protein